MDPSNAYPKKKYKPGVDTGMDKPDMVLVLDEVKSRIGARIEARFHPGVSMEIEEELTLLTGKEGRFMAIYRLPSLTWNRKTCLPAGTC